MRRIGMMAACFAAILAASAAVVASASAAFPELGRCVEVAPGTGQYKGKGCLTKAPGKGNHEWLPGPGAKPKFDGSGGEAKLEGPNLKILCSPNTYQGEYTGPNTLSVTVNFIGCTNIATNQTCQTNPVKPSEIETQGPLEGELGFIRSGSKPVVGLDIKRAPTLVVFECGKAPEAVLHVSLEGSVIGRIRPVNRMLEETKLGYKASALKQVPEAFEGGVKDTLTAKLIEGVTTTTEELVLVNPLVEIVNEEPLEIKTR
jgi:hypothetical protein